MTHYQIDNGVQTVTFSSEKEACEYLGVAQCSVASCYRSGAKCKGYTIRRIGDSFHRETKTRLHKIWESMQARCEYKKHPHYHNYGGRGIVVCEDWRDYLCFRKWALNNGYNNELTIDRVDNDGDYEPSNCRWISIKKQQNNKRNNRIITAHGESRTVSEWSGVTGIGKTTIKERLNAGWSDEDSVSRPVRERKRGYRKSSVACADMRRESEGST